MAVYRLFWDEFSSWYLRNGKTGLRLTYIDSATYAATLRITSRCLLRMLHPFTIFITEELWHLASVMTENQSCTLSDA